MKYYINRATDIITIEKNEGMFKAQELQYRQINQRYLPKNPVKINQIRHGWKLLGYSKVEKELREMLKDLPRYERRLYKRIAHKDEPLTIYDWKPYRSL